MLGAPKLKKLELFEAYLSEEQVSELLYMVREGRRGILKNNLEINWRNDFNFGELKPWMADEEHFNLLLDTLEAAFPQVQLQRRDEVSIYGFFFRLLRIKSSLFASSGSCRFCPSQQENSFAKMRVSCVLWLCAKSRRHCY
jgi:hypothetical protein